MPKVAPIITSFSAGEWSPLLAGRVDLKAYSQSMKTCYNSMPIVQGGWTRRPGTKFAHPAKDPSAKARLVRFEFSTTQAYILEFGNGYIRIFRNNGIVTQTAQNITGITKANPAVLTYSGADTFANGERVTVTGVLGMSQVNNREFTVANVNVGANTFELSGVDSSAYDTYTSGGSVAEIYEVATAYLTAELFQLKFAQSADTLYIVHPSHPPRKLTRTGHSAWTLSTISFTDGPYLPTNVTATTISLSGTTGSVTATASSATFAVTDVGRVIRWKDPANNWTWLAVSAFTSDVQVTVSINGPDASAGTATRDWRWGLTGGTNGYPAAVCFHEDRLWLGGCPGYPQRIDGSCSGDYENFAPSAVGGTVADDNAIGVTLNANDVNAIRWLSSDEKGFLIGTVGGEWVLKPPGNADALSPTNVSAKPSTRVGSANVEPIQAGKAVLFVNRSGRKLREMAYVYEVDGFRSPDMSALAEHITAGGMTQLAYQQNPQSIVWATRADGLLLGFTYDRESTVTAWHRHELGGYSDSGQTAAAVVESVACIPSSDGTRDELWMIVKRYINGGTVRYIEYLSKMQEENDDPEDLVYGVDCGLTYDSTPTTTLSGLWHLEGQTVTLLVDGATHPSETVTSGKITLDRSGSVVQIGLPYTSEGQPARIEAGAADGTAQGKKQRKHRTIFRLWKSLGLKVGADADNLYRPPMRTSAMGAGAAVELFTGDLEVDLEGDYTTEEDIYWQCDQPLPCTILAVMPHMNVQDR